MDKIQNIIENWVRPYVLNQDTDIKLMHISQGSPVKIIIEFVGKNCSNAEKRTEYITFMKHIFHNEGLDEIVIVDSSI